MIIFPTRRRLASRTSSRFFFPLTGAMDVGVSRNPQEIKSRRAPLRALLACDSDPPNEATEARLCSAIVSSLRSDAVRGSAGQANTIITYRLPSTTRPHRVESDWQIYTTKVTRPCQ